jgi:hypothetical protein
MVKRRKFIELDAKRIRADIRKTNNILNAIPGEVDAAIKIALAEFAEDMLAEAVQKAPVDEGFLRQSGTVSDPLEEGDGVVVFVSFNIVYGALRDQGTKGLPGGVIRPVRAQKLFIPLRKGVVPGQPGLERNVDFVLADSVRQEGNKYLTATFDNRKATAGQLIGQRYFEIMSAGLGSKKK